MDAKSDLSQYAERFARRLFSQWPEWKAFVQGGDSGVLNLLVPCPNPAVVYPLFIRVDDEVTIGLDRHHAHFHMFSEENEDEAFALALEHVRQLVSEKRIVVVRMFGNQCRMTMDQQIEFPLDARLNPGEHIYVRSWRGTHDTIVNVLVQRELEFSA